MWGKYMARLSHLVVMTAALAGAWHTDASANDRDLLATTVPAASCAVYIRPADSGIGDSILTWSGNAVVLGGIAPGDADLSTTNNAISLRCPLPINAIDLGGTTNDNDMTSFQVVYRDSDGPGAGTFVEVALVQTLLPAATGTGATLPSTTLCAWSSNTTGNSESGWTRATKACVHDLSGIAFYHFEVRLYTDQRAVADVYYAGFAGIRFP
jgi:hypothetical protein